MAKLLKLLIEEFNQVVTVGFGKKYDEYEPKKHAIVGSYKVPTSSASKAIFGLFLDGLHKVTGTPIPSETLPEANKVIVAHDPYAKRVEIPEEEFERAETVDDLNLYKSHVAGLAKIAKDFPVDMAMKMIEAGAASTYGVCFDGQNLFSTSHAYGDATSQSNLLSGTGTSSAQIEADLKSAINALEGFVYKQGDGYHKFNDNVKPLVICDTSKAAIFKDLQLRATINGTDNTLRGTFDLITEKLSDGSDFYVIDQDNGGIEVNAPILNPIEKEAEFTNNIGQESQLMDKVLKYQVYLRGGFGYGAWWKIVKVNN